MPADPESLPPSEPDRLVVATDQAIAACGGDARQAVKALLGNGIEGGIGR